MMSISSSTSQRDHCQHFSVMAQSAEYKKWSSYWDVLFDKRSPIVLKQSIVRYAPCKFILGLEELLINVKVLYIMKSIYM